MRRWTERILYWIAIFGLALMALRPQATVAETAPNYLPMAQERALTPRQYLWLKYPDVAPLADRIIVCESGWKPEVKNAGSSATGLGQFLSSTWQTTRIRMGEDPDLTLRTDPYVHIDTLVWLFEHDGPRHWLESSDCSGVR